MMPSNRPWWVRITAGLLCGTMVFTLAAPPFAEASIWEERSQAVKNGLRQRNAGPVTSAVQPIDLSSSGLEIPEELGAIVETWGDPAAVSSSGRPLVYFIEDAHGVYEAQRNAAGLLRIVLDHIQKNAVEARNAAPLQICVEGAWDRVSPEWISLFPDEKIRSASAESLLAAGRVSGEEYLSMLQPAGSLTIQGVENRRTYDANLKARHLLDQDRGLIADRLDRLWTRLRALKNKSYPRALLELDGAASQFDTQALPLKQYFAYLKRVAPAAWDPAQTPELAKLTSVIELESSVSVTEVERERRNLLETLSKTLDRATLAQLAQVSLEFRLGRVSAFKFHQGLSRLAQANQVPAPRIETYLQYLAAYQSLDSRAIAQEISILENAAFEQLAGKDETLLQLVRLNQSARTQTKFWTEKFAPEDWERHLKLSKTGENPPLPSMLEQSLLEQEKRMGLHPETPVPPRGRFSEQRQMFLQDAYYRLAFKRNAIMVDNALKAAQEAGQERMAIIAGGFHTAGMTEILRKINVPYVVLRPKLILPPTPGRPLAQTVDKDREFQKELSGAFGTLRSASPFMGSARVSFETELATELLGKLLAAVGPTVFQKSFKDYAQSLRNTALERKGIGASLNRMADILEQDLHFAPPFKSGEKTYILGAVQGRKARVNFVMEMDGSGAVRWISRDAQVKTLLSTLMFPKGWTPNDLLHAEESIYPSLFGTFKMDASGTPRFESNQNMEAFRPVTAPNRAELKQPFPTTAQPASIADTWAKRKWGGNTMKYKLYTILGVNWEFVYQLPALMLASGGPGLVIAGILISTVGFMQAHGQKTFNQKMALLGVGAILAAVTVAPAALLTIGLPLPGLDLMWKAVVLGLGLNWTLHSIYNALALRFNWVKASTQDPSSDQPRLKVLPLDETKDLIQEFISHTTGRLEAYHRPIERIGDQPGKTLFTREEAEHALEQGLLMAVEYNQNLQFVRTISAEEGRLISAFNAALQEQWKKALEILQGQGPYAPPVEDVVRFLLTRAEFLDARGAEEKSGGSQYLRHPYNQARTKLMEMCGERPEYFTYFGMERGSALGQLELGFKETLLNAYTRREEKPAPSALDETDTVAKNETFLASLFGGLFGKATEPQTGEVSLVSVSETEEANIAFGTNGWRAKMGSGGFSAANVGRLAQAIAEQYKSENINKPILVGYDARGVDPDMGDSDSFNSRRFAEEAAQVLAANGVSVHKVDRIAPTPALSALASSGEYGLALDFTASHNPYPDGGVKLLESNGNAVARDKTTALARRVNAITQYRRMDQAAAERAGRIEPLDIRTAYFSYLSSLMDNNARVAIASYLEKNPEFKVVLDPLHGAAAGWTEEALKRLGVPSQTIHSEPMNRMTHPKTIVEDGVKKPWSPSPEPAQLEELGRLVKSGNGRWLGAGLDGDGDRGAIVDLDGTLLQAHEFAAVALWYAKTFKRLPGGVARTVATSHLLDAVAAQFGEKTHETPVGFQYLERHMGPASVQPAAIAAEESNHFAMGHWRSRSDSIAQVLLAVEILAVTGKSFRQLLNEIQSKTGAYHYLRLDVPVSSSMKQKVVLDITQAWNAVGDRTETTDPAKIAEVDLAQKAARITGKTVVKVVTQDGVKIHFSNGGWILVRMSGTEGVLRLYVEGRTTEDTRLLSDAAKKLVNAPSSGPASVANSWAKDKWGEGSWKYNLYTVLGVNWESVFQAPLLILPALGMAWPWTAVAGIISALAFALAHRDRPPGQKLALFGVGAVLATLTVLPAVLGVFGLPFAWSAVLGLGLNFSFHSLYNALALKYGWPVASLPSGNAQTLDPFWRQELRKAKRDPQQKQAYQKVKQAFKKEILDAVKKDPRHAQLSDLFNREGGMLDYWLLTGRLQEIAEDWDAELESYLNMSVQGIVSQFNEILLDAKEQFTRTYEENTTRISEVLANYFSAQQSEYGWFVIPQDLILAVLRQKYPNPRALAPLIETSARAEMTDRPVAFLERLGLEKELLQAQVQSMKTAVRLDDFAFEDPILAKAPRILNQAWDLFFNESDSRLSALNVQFRDLCTVVVNRLKSLSDTDLGHFAALAQTGAAHTLTSLVPGYVENMIDEIQKRPMAMDAYLTALTGRQLSFAELKPILKTAPLGVKFAGGAITQEQLRDLLTYDGEWGFDVLEHKGEKLVLYFRGTPSVELRGHLTATVDGLSNVAGGFDGHSHPVNTDTEPSQIDRAHTERIIKRGTRGAFIVALRKDGELEASQCLNGQSWETVTGEKAVAMLTKIGLIGAPAVERRKRPGIKKKVDVPASENRANALVDELRKELATGETIAKQEYHDAVQPYQILLTYEPDGRNNGLALGKTGSSKIYAFAVQNGGVRAEVHPHEDGVQVVTFSGPKETDVTDGWIIGNVFETSPGKAGIFIQYGSGHEMAITEPLEEWDNPTGPATIVNKWAVAKWGINSWKYKLYTTLGVNWESVFQAPLLILPALGMAWPWTVVAGIISALAFALAHRDRPPGQKLALFGVGAVLSTLTVLPAVLGIFGLPFVWSAVLGLGLNFSFHSLYNALAVKRRWSAASVFSVPNPNDLESLLAAMRGGEKDVYTLAEYEDYRGFKERQEAALAINERVFQAAEKLALSNPAAFNQKALSVVLEKTLRPKEHDQPFALDLLPLFMRANPGLFTAQALEDFLRVAKEPFVVGQIIRGHDRPDYRGLEAFLLANPAAFTSQNLELALPVRPRSDSAFKIARYFARANPAAVLDAVTARTWDEESKALVFDALVEPLSMQRPELFTRERFNNLDSALGSTPAFKYLAHHLSVRGNRLLDSRLSGYFPARAQAQRILRGSGLTGLMVVNSMKSGLGDDVIWQGGLLQNLLGFAPRMKAALYGVKPFVFAHDITAQARGSISQPAHPQISSIEPLGKLNARQSAGYEVVLEFKNALPDGENAGILNALDRALDYQRITKDKNRIYIRIVRDEDAFRPSEVFIGGQKIVLPENWEFSAYSNIQRLFAELGIPYRPAQENSARAHVLTQTESRSGDDYWKQTVLQANVEQRPVVLFNPFGGEKEEKGILRPGLAARILERLAKNNFVILASNNMPWGRQDLAKDLAAQLPDSLRKNVLVAPEAKPTPLMKDLTARVDRVVTVEGGLMHLAHALGKPMVAIESNGTFDMDRWFPADARADQTRVFAPLALETNLDQAQKKPSASSIFLPFTMRQATIPRSRIARKLYRLAAVLGRPIRVAPLWEEAVFRLLPLGLTGTTSAILSAYDPLGLFLAFGLSTGLFAALHVLVRRLSQGMPVLNRAALDEFAFEMGPAIGLTFVFLLVSGAATAYLGPGLAALMAYAASVVTHMVVNWIRFGDDPATWTNASEYRNGNFRPAPSAPAPIVHKGSLSVGMTGDEIRTALMELSRVRRYVTFQGTERTLLNKGQGISTEEALRHEKTAAQFMAIVGAELTKSPELLTLFNETPLTFLLGNEEDARAPPYLKYLSNPERFLLAYGGEVATAGKPAVYLSMDMVEAVVSALKDPLASDEETQDRKSTLARMMAYLVRSARDPGFDPGVSSVPLQQDLLRHVLPDLQRRTGQAAKLEFLHRTRKRNFISENIPTDKAAFILLPVQNGRDKLPLWFDRMMLEINRIPQNLHVEIMVLSNGSTDDDPALAPGNHQGTPRIMDQLMAQYKDRVRVTFMNVPENIGKSQSVNYLYFESLRRYRAAKAANPNLDLYLHYSDDDAFPTRTGPSLIESNIGMLEGKVPEDQAAGRRDLSGLKAVGSTPVAPPFEFSWRPSKLYRYLFQRMTNVRKGYYRTPVAQIYGQSYTVHINNFPEDGIPEDLRYEDCYLCAYFYPNLSTNPDAHHEHAEPATWNVFSTRFMRDLLHANELAEWMSRNPKMGQQYEFFAQARARSHAQLTKEIQNKNALFSLTRFLLWMNKRLKDILAWRVQDGWTPGELRGKKSMYRGTNITNVSGSMEIFRETSGNYSITTDEGLVHSDRETLWSTIIVMEMDKNMDNVLTFDEVAQGIRRLPYLKTADLQQLDQTLEHTWRSLGRTLDQPVRVSDFAAALEHSFAENSRLGEYFQEKRMALWCHAIHNSQDWVLAYTALTRLREYLRNHPTQAAIAHLLNAARRSDTQLHPLIAREILATVHRERIPLSMERENIILQRPLGAAWLAMGAETGEQMVLAFSSGKDHVRADQMHKLFPERAAETLFYDSALQIRAMPFLGGTAFGEYAEAPHPLSEWLDIAFQLGEVAGTLNRKGMIHGDLRRPNAVVRRTPNHTPQVVLLNGGASEWERDLAPGADVFGLCAMLYYGLTKQDPHLDGEYEWIYTAPQELNRILKKGLEKSQDRYDSMETLIRDLRAFQEGLLSNSVSGYTQLTLAHLAPKIPAIQNIEWREGVFKADVPAHITLPDDQLLALLRAQEPGTQSWADHRLANGILERYMEDRPGEVTRVETLARRNLVRIQPFLVQIMMRLYSSTQTEFEQDGKHYRVEKTLNPRVFLVRQTSDKSLWVLKIASTRETDITHTLSEPGYVRSYDPIRGTLIVQHLPGEFLEGLEEPGPDQLVRILQATISAAQAVRAVNARGYVHRDAYAHNIRRTAGGQVRFIDYGLSEKSEPTTERVDIMILAQSLHNLLWGQQRWLPLAYRFRQPEGGPPTEPIPTIPQFLNDAIGKAVRREYASADEFIADLETAAGLLQDYYGQDIAMSFGHPSMEKLMAQRQAAPKIAVTLEEAQRIEQGVSPLLRTDENIRVFMTQAEANLPAPLFNQVKAAWRLAGEIHYGQTRSDNDPTPYVAHLAAVARRLVIQFKMFSMIDDSQERANALCAAFLHDAVEDAIKGNFGYNLLYNQEGKYDEDMARVLVRNRIMTEINPETAEIVSLLTKPPRKPGVSGESIKKAEENYIRGLENAPLAVQLIRMADWHHNFSALIAEYSHTKEGRKAAHYYFHNRVDGIIRYLRKTRLIPLTERILLLEHILQQGRANNAFNKRISGAEDIVAMTPEQERKLTSTIDKLHRFGNSQDNDHENGDTPTLAYRATLLIKELRNFWGKPSSTWDINKLLLRMFEAGRDPFGGELFPEETSRLQSLLAEYFAVSPAKVTVEVSRNLDLVRNDAWAMAALDVQPNSGKVTLYVHQMFLQALRDQAPAVRETILLTLAAHENLEYMALYNIDHPLYKKFGEYLSQNKTGTVAARTPEAFHAFIMDAYRSRQTGELLSTVQSALAPQAGLLRFAEETARKNGFESPGLFPVGPDESEPSLKTEPLRINNALEEYKKALASNDLWATIQITREVQSAAQSEPAPIIESLIQELLRHNFQGELKIRHEMAAVQLLDEALKSLTFNSNLSAAVLPMYAQMLYDTLNTFAKSTDIGAVSQAARQGPLRRILRIFPLVTVRIFHNNLNAIREERRPTAAMEAAEIFPSDGTIQGASRLARLVANQISKINLRDVKLPEKYLGFNPAYAENYIFMMRYIEFNLSAAENLSRGKLARATPQEKALRSLWNVYEDKSTHWTNTELVAESVKFAHAAALVHASMIDPKFELPHLRDVAQALINDFFAGHSGEDLKRAVNAGEILWWLKEADVPQAVAAFEQESRFTNSPVLARIQRRLSTTDPASIGDDWAKERWGEDSLRYKLYTVLGVHWEILFQVPALLAALGGMSLGPVAVFGLISSSVFAVLHLRPRAETQSPYAFLKFMAVGILLNAALVTPVLLATALWPVPIPAEVLWQAIIGGIGLNVLLHSAFNALALRLDWRPASLFNPEALRSVVQEQSAGLLRTAASAVPAGRAGLAALYAPDNATFRHATARERRKVLLTLEETLNAPISEEDATDPSTFPGQAAAWTSPRLIQAGFVPSGNAVGLMVNGGLALQASGLAGAGWKSLMGRALLRGEIQSAMIWSSSPMRWAAKLQVLLMHPFQSLSAAFTLIRSAAGFLLRRAVLRWLGAPQPVSTAQKAATTDATEDELAFIARQSGADVPAPQTRDSDSANAVGRIFSELNAQAFTSALAQDSAAPQLVLVHVQPQSPQALRSAVQGLVRSLQTARQADPKRAVAIGLVLNLDRAVSADTFDQTAIKTAAQLGIPSNLLALKAANPTDAAARFQNLLALADSPWKNASVQILTLQPAAWTGLLNRFGNAALWVLRQIASGIGAEVSIQGTLAQTLYEDLALSNDRNTSWDSKTRTLTLAGQSVDNALSADLWARETLYSVQQ